MIRNAQTITEKILSKAAQKTVFAGDITHPEPDLIVVHDWYAANVGAILKNFGVKRLFDPDKVLFVTDHEPLAVSQDAAVRQRKIREVVEHFRIGKFFDVGRGGHGHVFPVQTGLVQPGMYVAAYDTHVPNYGAVGALGVAFLTEIAEVLALGSIWVRVPETVRVNLTGKLRKWVSVRDFAQRLISDLDAEVVDYTVVEFGGPALMDLPFDARFTLCNTPIELGAKSALVEPDAATVDYVVARGTEYSNPIASDQGAEYQQIVHYDLGEITPQVALPPVPDNVVSIGDVAGTPIQHAFIGSCASGMLDDLRIAAQVLRNHEVHPKVRLFITPATHEILAQAATEGLTKVFAEAGAIVTAPGCGPCALGRIGGLAPGENSINTGTRNDYGRLGPSDAQIYLAAPASVAAAAIVGHIVDPRDFMGE